MMISLVRFGIAIACLLVLANANAALACSCPFPTMRASEMLKLGKSKKATDGAAIFVGRVEKYVEGNNDETSLAIIQVINLVYGTSLDRVELRGISSDDNSCGLPIRLNDVALFYIYKIDGRWTTNVCSSPSQDLTTKELLEFASISGQK